MKGKILLAALVATPIVLSSLAPAVAEGNGPIGLWVMNKEKLTVRIRSCGVNNICAVIAALKKPLDAAGRPKVDKNNPDPSLRNRPLMGLEVISNMVPDGINEWKGKIYNADDGETYRAQARLRGDKFMVKGCWTFFCKKLNFTRVKEVAAN